jgi:hypothetical protein
MTTDVTTRNPVRADLRPSGTPTPTTRRTSNGWALAGVAAGMLGIGTMVSSSTIMVFGTALAARVASYFATARPPTPDRDEPFPDLTDRENDVLELLASGSSNDAIARALYVSDKTVRNPSARSPRNCTPPAAARRSSRRARRGSAGVSANRPTARGSRRAGR